MPGLLSGTSSPVVDGRRWWVGGNQRVATVADQITSARLEQCLADGEVVLGFEELHQRALQLAVAQELAHVDRF